jgi:hypothetical protein
MNAADPLNLVGIILPGARVTAVRTNSITYRDGLPVTDEDVTASLEASAAWSTSTPA